MRLLTLSRPLLLWLVAMSGLAASPAWADVRLPALIRSGMVLQRDAKIDLWGWAEPAEKVHIAFRGSTVHTEADRNGRWSMSLGPYAAGGPHELTVTGRNVIVLRDVLIGDVWLASGQSNMEWPLRAPAGYSVNNAQQEITGAHFPQVRLFAVENDAAPRPKDDVISQGWRAATPETVVDFSAVSYLFARELHQRYAIPIGIIESDWGGTVAETWVSADGLRNFPEFHKAMQSLPRVKPEARAAYERYKREMAAWYKAHEGEDRGQRIWADPKFDDSLWPQVEVPRPASACGSDLGGFGGVLWLRKSVTVSPEQAGVDAVLHLGRPIQDDTTYFNGEKVGEMQGSGKPRHYTVPGKYVRAGENVIAMRVVGFVTPDLGCTGMYLADGMTIETGAVSQSLTGMWRQQPGPDLRDFPVASVETLAARPAASAPTVLYNGMINPLVPYRIKGVIWYQGESNAIDRRAVQYRTLFPALIEDWRRHWGYQMPFLFVQLAGFGPDGPEPAESVWAELREAQSMALTLPGTGMATAIDIGDEHDIHPGNKQDVAHRLVLAAARVAYGEDIVHCGPTYRSMNVEGRQIRITYSCLGSGLLVKDKFGYARGFQIAGIDGKFHWAQARREGDDFLIFSDSVTQPVAVRYDWGNTPDGNVYNKEGLPALPFRTDVPRH
jgi:sialate O-acetylesterase